MVRAMSCRRLTEVSIGNGSPYLRAGYRHKDFFMFELKPLSREAVPSALEKANRYRLLNEPGAAESIYLDVLAVEPDNQDALRNIVLAMSDRFGKDYAVGDTNVNEYLQ